MVLSIRKDADRIRLTALPRLRFARGLIPDRGQIHLAAVIEETPAMSAGHQILLLLAGKEYLYREPHMAPATNAMLDSDENGTSFLLA
jgi:hypothetical protein